MRAFESINRHPYRAGTAAALVIAIAAAEIAGQFNNPTYDTPEGACVSPPAVSKTYVEPGASTLFQTYTGLFTPGVVAHGKLSGDAYGVQASFKSPDAPASEWDKNASAMIKADKIGDYALKMTVGDGKVQFGIRIVAPEGSPLCTTAPIVDFEQLDQASYPEAQGKLPWPNVVNVISNL